MFPSGHSGSNSSEDSLVEAQSLHLEPDPERQLSVLGVGRGMFRAGYVRPGGRGGEERFILLTESLM